MESQSKHLRCGVASSTPRACLGALAFGCPQGQVSFPAAQILAPLVETSPDLAWMSAEGASPVVAAGQVVGSVWEDASARNIVLFGLGGYGPTRAQQTHNVYDRLEDLLGQHSFCLSDVIRTWWYLDELLSWYGDFNQVRTQRFEAHGVFGKLVPASTGIGATNITGSAVSLTAWARIPKKPEYAAQAVASPLQCPATAYRSSFSRGVEFGQADGSRFLSISGTASIAPDGKSAHLGDMAQQVNLTVEVIQAILAARNFSWSHAERAIAYVRRRQDVPIWQAIRQNDPRLAMIPCVSVEATVCRDDLLFEMEVDLVRR